MSIDIWVKENVGDLNMTHNVAPMWHEAGCYDALYMSNGMQALDCLPFLVRGLADMEARPQVYIKLNPENGWGDYDTAKDFLRRVIRLFQEHPHGEVGICK